MYVSQHIVTTFTTPLLQIRPSEDFVPSFNPDTGVARLTVPTVMSEDVGNYTVLAENPFGRDQNTANLIIVEGSFIGKFSQ